MSPSKSLFSCLPCKKQKAKKGKGKGSKKKQDVEMRGPNRRNSMQGFISVADRKTQLFESARWKKTEVGEVSGSLAKRQHLGNKYSPLETTFTSSTPRRSTKVNVSIPITPKSPDYSFKKEDEFVEFGKFAEAKDLMTVLQFFSEMCKKLGLEQEQVTTFNSIFPFLREKLKHRIPNKYDKLLQQLEFRAACREYQNNTVAKDKKVLVLGAGPCGLRLAMEIQLLGAETTVLEARTDMTRNNVLKLWTFVMEDLKSLGARSLYHKLEHGSINHISIWMLQLILVKMTILLGVQVRVGETFKSVEEPTGDRGWVAVIERMEEGRLVTVKEEYDIVVCATGRKVPLQGFDRKNPETKMAIAVTANWKNLGSPQEMAVGEIPGLSWQNNMEFFQALENQHGISLENIVHFKDMTHYFVMTAKKDSLLKKGVLLNDTKDRDSLLAKDNVDQEALEQFALEAATFSTGYFSKELPSTPLEDKPTIFDFTHLYRSKNACRVKQRKGHRLLLGLVGDSLQQPFWPEGLGISRGFLSVFDAAWMIKQYCTEPSDQVYEVIREREKNYILQKTADNNLKKNYEQWTINPNTRYPTATTNVKKEQVGDLYDTDQDD